MSEFENLSGAVVNLSICVSNFLIGAVSLDDFKPVEEKIRDARESLKHLNAKLLILRARKEFQTTDEEPEEDLRNTVTNLHNASVRALIDNATIKLCLHSHTLQAILAGKEGDHDMQKKIYGCMCKLFGLNDNIVSIQRQTEDAYQRKVELQSECKNALFKHKNFLDEQEQTRNKRLQETNPIVAKNKEKTNKTLKNINIMKALIVNFIAASNHKLLKMPDLVEMVVKHKELVTMDTILKISQDNPQTEED